MICPNCKNEIPDNIFYCPMCGSLTGGVPQPPVPYSDTASQQATKAPQETNSINQVQAQSGYMPQAQPVQQYASYQQGYGTNSQANFQSNGYTPDNYTYINGQPYSVPRQTHTKKKMSPLAIIGIVAGGFVGLVILLVIVVTLFSAGDSGGGYSGGGYYPPDTEETIDFVLSGTYDDEGREIVHNLNGDEIGYADDGNVYIPIEEGYIVVCDEDGRIIGRTYDTLPGYEPEGEPANGDDNGAGDYNPPPTEQTKQQPEKGTSAANGFKNDNKNNKPSEGKNNNSSGGAPVTNNVSADVVQFVDSMFGAVEYHETHFVEACTTNGYKNLSFQMFGSAVASFRLDGGYSECSAYMTEDEYNKAKKSFSDSVCSVYNKSAIEKSIKAIWGNKLSINDFLKSYEFVSSKGYIVKNSIEGYGDGAEHYWNVVSQEIKGDHIVVKVQMIGYSWYDGGLWDAVNYTDVIADIGAEDSPSSFHEAIERGSVDETKLSCITVYLKNTSDGLKLDYME